MKKLKKNFFLHGSIYIPKYAQSKFEKLLGLILVSLTSQKTVIPEKQHF